MNLSFIFLVLLSFIVNRQNMYPLFKKSNSILFITIESILIDLIKRHIDELRLRVHKNMSRQKNILIKEKYDYMNYGTFKIGKIMSWEA